MQLAGQQSALLTHRCLALQRRRTQALQRAGQMAGQSIQQLHFIGTQIHRAAKKQIYLANQSLLQADRNTHQTFITRLRTMPHGSSLMGKNRNDACCGIGFQTSTGTRTGQKAALVFHHILWKTIRRQHQIALVGVIGPTHGDRIGFHHAAHPLRETFGELFDGIGLG